MLSWLFWEIQVAPGAGTGIVAAATVLVNLTLPSSSDVG
jgi:hypothetical protein